MEIETMLILIPFILCQLLVPSVQIHPFKMFPFPGTKYKIPIHDELNPDHIGKIPEQVHLSLTNQPDEMVITWITFKPVDTFVEYKLYSSKIWKPPISATRTEYTYKDLVDPPQAPENRKIEPEEISIVRYIHSVTLKNLKRGPIPVRYDYKLGFYPKTPKPKSKIYRTENAADQNAKIFYFNTFSTDPNAKLTACIFGDKGLLNPAAEIPLQTLIHNNFKKGAAAGIFKGLSELEKELSKNVEQSFKDKNSSGLKMKSAQIILHIGDIAYDMHRNVRMNKKVVNFGDEYFRKVESVAAYVPYMVVAGNHENEREKHEYEHYETRFRMPLFHSSEMYSNQYYDFQMGPFWFIGVSTELYYFREGAFLKADLSRIEKQFNFVKDSLKRANENHQRTPWIIILQHRPFYCTSQNEFTCEKNKWHQLGIKDDKSKTYKYGLEALYNENFVDLVITGHEHIYERFPPIEFRHGVIQGVNQKLNFRKGGASIDHFVDALGPAYIITGQPGNNEEIEKITEKPKFGRAAKSDVPSITLLHSPGAKKNLISIRQINLVSGGVVDEFLLEKSYSNYNMVVETNGEFLKPKRDWNLENVDFTKEYNKVEPMRNRDYINMKMDEENEAELREIYQYEYIPCEVVTVGEVTKCHRELTRNQKIRDYLRKKNLSKLENKNEELHITHENSNLQDPSPSLSKTEADALVETIESITVSDKQGVFIKENRLECLKREFKDKNSGLKAVEIAVNKGIYSGSDLKTFIETKLGQKFGECSVLLRLPIKQHLAVYKAYQKIIPFVIFGKEHILDKTKELRKYEMKIELLVIYNASEMVASKLVLNRLNIDRSHYENLKIMFRNHQLTIIRELKNLGALKSMKSTGSSRSHKEDAAAVLKELFNSLEKLPENLNKIVVI